MKELLAQFAVNPINLLAHILNFGIVFCAIYFLLLKKLFIYIDEKKKEIEDTMKLQTDLSLKHIELEQFRKDIIKQAKNEALTLVENAREKADIEYNKKILILNSDLINKQAEFERKFEFSKKIAFDSMGEELKEMSKKIAEEFYHELRNKK